MAEETVCRTANEYQAAIKKRAARIRIVNADLARKTILVKAIPGTAIVAALGLSVFAIGAVHTGIMGFAAAPATGGVSTIGGAILFGTAGTVMVPIYGLVGGPAAIALVTLGVAIGGGGALTALYDDYKIVDFGASYVVLRKK
jgi:hypothetical protein